MNYADFTSKISGFPTSRWEDKVTATKTRRVFNTHEDPPDMVFKSGLIVLISIVFLVCFTGNTYDISVYNYLLWNILVYFQNVWLFLYLGQSRWEDKVTATKIRGSSTCEWINDANFHCSFLCYHGDML